MLNGILCEPQGRSGRFREEKNILPTHREMNHDFSIVYHSLITLQTVIGCMNIVVCFMKSHPRVVLMRCLRRCADVSSMVSTVRGANYSTPFPPTLCGLHEHRAVASFSIIQQIHLRRTNHFLPSMMHSFGRRPDVQNSKAFVKLQVLTARCWSDILNMKARVEVKF